MPTATGVAVLAASLSIVSACGKSPEDRLIAQLEEEPLIRVLPGGTIAGWSGPNVAACWRTWEQSGVDVFAAYRRAPLGSHARQSLAYALLLANDARYVAEAAVASDALARSGEFYVWLRVLDDPSPSPPDGYRRQMVEILRNVHEPYADVAVGRELCRAGSVPEGVETLLGVMGQNSRWGAVAFRALVDVARDHSDVLLSYLTEESYKGIHAAAVLRMDERHRKTAELYLNSAAKSPDETLAHLAARELEQAGRSDRHTAP